MEAADENNMQAGRGHRPVEAVRVLQPAAKRAPPRQLLLVMGALMLAFPGAFHWLGPSSSGAFWPPMAEAAVSVQRLSVPDLIVIDQFNQQLQPHTAARQPDRPSTGTATEPQAARLTNSPPEHNNLFDCLISYDRHKDSNLVVKWYHDDKPDAIYQWIPELHTSPSIAPHYKPYIAPLRDEAPQPRADAGQQQLLRAAFKLLRPSKDFNGKYKCAATSSQNDDSKWKKMIVFTPSSNFRFNVSRVAPAAAQLAPGGWRKPSALQQASNQMPIVYRLKGFEGIQQPALTPAPPDYVNLSQQRLSRFRSGSTHPATNLQQPFAIESNYKQAGRAALKLVCDIDQVFPLPEVTIYRLAKSDGSHPDKLANQETQRQRNPTTGLYSVQVTGIVDEEELTRIKYATSPNLPESIYFECLIALNDLQLSKYDNKRTILYKPEALIAGEDITGTSGHPTNAHQILLLFLMTSAFLFQLNLTNRLVWHLSICPSAG